MVGRRAVLATGAATIAGVAVGAATGTLTRLVGAAGQRVPEPVVRAERVYSVARGREVRLVTVLPIEMPIKDLPVCLFLHGLRSTAAGAIPASVVNLVVRSVAHDRIPPFALVAVDGGDSYWHQNRPGDDPMRMLLAELPAWLRARHLGSVFAASGFSMGGFGSLLYARRRAERGDALRGAVAVSPGLMEWSEMRKRGAFRDEREWAGLDPRNNVGALGGTSVAVWCGAQDAFAAGTREFISAARPRIGRILPGRHDGRFQDVVAEDQVEFLGDVLEEGR
jgi:S-formylglutathione hydrolase FrmB